MKQIYKILFSCISAFISFAYKAHAECNCVDVDTDTYGRDVYSGQYCECDGVYATYQCSKYFWTGADGKPETGPHPDRCVGGSHCNEANNFCMDFFSYVDVSFECARGEYYDATSGKCSDCPMDGENKADSNGYKRDRKIIKGWEKYQTKVLCVSGGDLNNDTGRSYYPWLCTVKEVHTGVVVSDVVTGISSAEEAATAKKDCSMKANTEYVDETGSYFYTRVCEYDGE